MFEPVILYKSNPPEGKAISIFPFSDLVFHFPISFHLTFPIRETREAENQHGMFIYQY